MAMEPTSKRNRFGSKRMMTHIRQAVRCLRVSKNLNVAIRTNIERFAKITNTQVTLQFPIGRETVGKLTLHTSGRKRFEKLISVYLHDGKEDYQQFSHFEDNICLNDFNGMKSRLELIVKTEDTAAFFRQVLKKLNTLFEIRSCSLTYGSSFGKLEHFFKENDLLEALGQVQSAEELRMTVLKGAPKFKINFDRKFVLSDLATKFTSLYVGWSDGKRFTSEFDDFALSHMTNLEEFTLETYYLPREGLPTGITSSGVRRLLEDAQDGKRRLKYFFFGVKDELEDLSAAISQVQDCSIKCVHSGTNSTAAFFNFDKVRIFVDIKKTSKSGCQFESKTVSF